MQLRFKLQRLKYECSRDPTYNFVQIFQKGTSRVYFKTNLYRLIARFYVKFSNLHFNCKFYLYFRSWVQMRKMHRVINYNFIYISKFNL